MMDVKILHSPTPLETPAISLQDFTAELAISFRVIPLPGTFAPIHVQTP